MSDETKKVEVTLDTLISELVERHGVANKALENDIKDLILSVYVKKPSYLELTSFTEGKFYIPTVNGTLSDAYIEICGMDDDLVLQQDKIRQANEQHRGEMAVRLTKDIFKKCVLGIHNVKMTKTVDSYKRGDATPSFSEITDQKIFDEIVRVFPQRIKKMVIDSVQYLTNTNEEDLKNLK